MAHEKILGFMTICVFIMVAFVMLLPMPVSALPSTSPEKVFYLGDIIFMHPHPASGIPCYYVFSGFIGNSTFIISRCNEMGGRASFILPCYYPLKTGAAFTCVFESYTLGFTTTVGPYYRTFTVLEYGDTWIKFKML